MVLDNTVKIDQIVLTGILIISIRSIEFLVEHGYMTISNYGPQYITKEGQRFSSIRILDDDYIVELKAGCYEGGPYCHIRLSVQPEDTNGNLICYSCDEYFKYLFYVQKHLLDSYGIEVYLEEVRIREIEINKTFPIDKPFTTYHRVFKLIGTSMPYPFRRGNDHYFTNSMSRIHKGYTFTTRKTNHSQHYISLKIYDKSQFFNGRFTNILRVEYKFVGLDRVSKSFDFSGYFLDLTNETINSTFEKYFQKTIGIPIENWKTSQEALIKKMKELRSLCQNQWQKNFLNYLNDMEINTNKPLILDVRELFPLLERKNRYGNPMIKDRRKRYTIRKNFLAKCQITYKALQNNDHLLLNEILEKLQTNLS